MQLYLDAQAKTSAKEASPFEASLDADIDLSVDAVTLSIVGRTADGGFTIRLQDHSLLGAEGRSSQDIVEDVADAMLTVSTLIYLIGKY